MKNSQAANGKKAQDFANWQQRDTINNQRNAAKATYKGKRYGDYDTDDFFRALNNIQDTDAWIDEAKSWYINSKASRETQKKQHRSNETQKKATLM